MVHCLSCSCVAVSLPLRVSKWKVSEVLPPEPRGCASQPCQQASLLMLQGAGRTMPQCSSGTDGCMAAQLHCGTVPVSASGTELGILEAQKEAHLQRVA